MEQKIVQIKGGLGNQLYQLAFALYLKDCGYKVILDDSWFKYKPKNDTPREPYILARQKEFTVDTFYLRYNLDRLYSKLIIQTQDEFDMSFIARTKYFSGYYQNDVIARRYAADIRKILDIKYDDTVHASWLAVHIRRGDFIKLGLPTVNIEQYIHELHHFNGFNKIFLFTDEWERVCNEALNYDIEFCKPLSGSDWDQFLYLCSFRKIIYSNSTFGVWAAHLAAATAELRQVLPNSSNRREGY